MLKCTDHLGEDGESCVSSSLFESYTFKGRTRNRQGTEIIVLVNRARPAFLRKFQGIRFPFEQLDLFHVLLWY